MKIKLVESFEDKRNFKPHTIRLLKLIGSDLLDNEVNESIEPITMNEDMNDGTVRKDSTIISLVDNSHLECVIENAVPGTCSFVGQYLDGDSAGTKYTFVYCDEAGTNFAATRFNTTPDQLPTEIFEVDGEDKGSYMIFTDEEIRSLKNDVNEALDIRSATNKLIDMMEEGMIDATKLATNLLQWMSEDDVKDFAREYDYFNDDETLTEAVDTVDLILNDDEVMDLDERTGDITIYDDVIDYTPELPIVFKFAEDEDNVVHKYVMKEHDEEAGTIRLAYAGPDELRESLLLEKLNRLLQIVKLIRLLKKL